MDIVIIGLIAVFTATPVLVVMIDLSMNEASFKEWGAKKKDPRKKYQKRLFPIFSIVGIISIILLILFHCLSKTQYQSVEVLDSEVYHLIDMTECDDGGYVFTYINAGANHNIYVPSGKYEIQDGDQNKIEVQTVIIQSVDRWGFFYSSIVEKTTDNFYIVS